MKKILFLFFIFIILLNPEFSLSDTIILKNGAKLDSIQIISIKDGNLIIKQNKKILFIPLQIVKEFENNKIPSNKLIFEARKNIDFEPLDIALFTIGIVEGLNYLDLKESKAKKRYQNRALAISISCIFAGFYYLFR